MSETANYLGSSLGLALLGVIGASVYRSHMAHAVAAGAQAAAGQTLAGAAAASTHLPAGRAAGLLDAARAAFTSGLHVTGVVAAVIFAALALLIAAARPGRAAAEAPAAAADEAFEGARS
jgi:MFS transporter, DHA2 family, multidrug resistance protein